MNRFSFRRSIKSADFVENDDDSPASGFAPAPAPAQSPIRWTGIARNNVLLAQARADILEKESSDEDPDYNPFQRRKKKTVVGPATGGEQDVVSRTAAALLRKSPTPGWEFYNTKTLRGVKFHLYEYEREDRKDQDTARNGEHDFIIWTFACLFEPSPDNNHGPNTQVAQAFLDKLVALTEVCRDTDAAWKYGSTHAAQDSFGPVLRHQLLHAPATLQVQQKIDYCQDLMSRNIERILARGERVQDLQEEATQLQSMADVFRKKSQSVRRRMMWQNAKHGLAIGTAISAGVAIVVVPPLVAIL